MNVPLAGPPLPFQAAAVPAGSIAQFAASVAKASVKGTVSDCAWQATIPFIAARQATAPARAIPDRIQFIPLAMVSTPGNCLENAARQGGLHRHDQSSGHPHREAYRSRATEGQLRRHLDG